VTTRSVEKVPWREISQIAFASPGDPVRFLPIADQPLILKVAGFRKSLTSSKKEL
jgi:hypothetical protein